MTAVWIGINFIYILESQLSKINDEPRQIAQFQWTIVAFISSWCVQRFFNYLFLLPFSTSLFDFVFVFFRRFFYFYLEFGQPNISIFVMILVVALYPAQQQQQHRSFDFYSFNSYLVWTHRNRLRRTKLFEAILQMCMHTLLQLICD